MNEIESLLESSKVQAISVLTTVCAVGWYCIKRYRACFFCGYGGAFDKCTVDELKELKHFFDEYRKVSAQQHQDILHMREALSTLRDNLQQASSSKKRVELCNDKLITVSRLLSEYPVLSKSVKKASEIEKLRIEREEYHENVKLAFEDYLKDVNSSIQSLQISNEGSSVVSVNNQ